MKRLASNRPSVWFWGLALMSTSVVAIADCGENCRNAMCWYWQGYNCQTAITEYYVAEGEIGRTDLPTQGFHQLSGETLVRIRGSVAPAESCTYDTDCLRPRIGVPGGSDSPWAASPHTKCGPLIGGPL